MLAHALAEAACTHSQDWSQLFSHLARAAPLLWIIARPAEVAGVGPDRHPLFINGQKPALSIHNRAAATQRIAAFGLGLASAAFELFASHQLQPSQPHAQSAQGAAKQHHHRDQATGGHRVEFQDPPPAFATSHARLRHPQ